MSEMCYTRLAGNAGQKKQKLCKNGHLLTITHYHSTLSGCIFATKTRIDNRKKLVKQQYLLHMPYNMVNFGPLTAEIGSGVCGIPANFNGFRV